VGLVQLDGAAETLLRPVPEGPFAALLEHYQKQGVRARVTSFKPADVPALMLYPEGAEIAREAGEALEAGELPEAIGGLIGEYVERRFSGGKDLEGTLYLNGSCPLVRRLAEETPAGPGRAAALDLVLQVARLFCGRMLSAADATKAFKELTRALGGLL
jgi:hypothetical protein